MINKPVQRDWDQLQSFSEWIAEPKLDGMRCMLSEKGLIREDGHNKSHQFPEIPFLESGTVLDGEVCILENQLRADFYKLLNRNTTNNLAIKVLSKTMAATFVAFDIMRHAGTDVTSLPFSERRKLLCQIPTQTGLQIMIQEKPDTLAAKVTRNNMEGIVLKNPDGKYADEWIKLKYYLEKDFRVIGFTSENRLISALELEDLEGNYVGKVNYTGYPQTPKIAAIIEKTKPIAVVRFLPSPKQKLRTPILKELRIN